MKFNATPISAALTGILWAIVIVAFEIFQKKSESPQLYHVVVFAIVSIIFILIPGILLVSGLKIGSLLMGGSSPVRTYYRKELPQLSLRFICCMAGMFSAMYFFRLINKWLTI